MKPFEQVREIMALTFDLPPDAITPTTAQDSCPQWDSLAHLNLMLALEDAFGLTLTVDDMAQLTSVAAILARLPGG
jgi:acyl carrier protein